MSKFVTVVIDPDNNEIIGVYNANISQVRKYLRYALEMPKDMLDDVIFERQSVENGKVFISKKMIKETRARERE